MSKEDIYITKENKEKINNIITRVHNGEPTTDNMIKMIKDIIKESNVNKDKNISSEFIIELLEKERRKGRITKGGE